MVVMVQHRALAHPCVKNNDYLTEHLSLFGALVFSLLVFSLLVFSLLVFSLLVFSLPSSDADTAATRNGFILPSLEIIMNDLVVAIVTS